MESRDFPRGAIGAITWWGGVSFFLFGLILLNNDLGPLTRQTSLAAAILLFIIVAVILLPRVFEARQFWCYAASIATIILIWFLTIAENISAPTQSYFLASTIIYAVGALWFDKNGLQSSLPAVLLLTGFLYSIFHLVYDYLPGVWYFLQAGSQIASSLVSGFFEQRQLFGATAFGLPILALFGVLLFAAFLLSSSSDNQTGKSQNSRKRRLGFLILVFLALAAIHTLWVVLQGPLIQFLAESLAYQHLTPLHLLIIPFLLDLIPTSLYFRTRKFTSVTYSWRDIHVAAVAFFTTAFFLATVVLTWPDLVKPDNSKKNVFILNRGYFNWEKPKFGQYGLTSAGMFGLLPNYLQALDYHITVDSVITAERLSNVQVLMMINLNQMLETTEKAVIEEFIRSGHSLLVLGDHTGLGEMMPSLNDLLQTTGIQFNFDSAHYLKDGWSHTFAFMPHVLNSAIKNEDDMGISVGASLSLSLFKARPVITAKYGFSDFGNWLNKQNAYLGDRRYNPGELLGDIVLIAEARVGKGKILVFGDTSSLQNGSLTRTFNFTDNMLQWLACSTGNDWRNIRAIIGAMLLLVIAGFFLRSVRKHRNVTVVIIAFGGMMLAVLLTSTIAAGNRHQAIPHGHVAYIDMSHLERFEMYGDGGIWSLLYTLMRSDYLPFVYQDFSQAALIQSKVLFEIAPAKPLSNEEQQWVDDYLRQGGLVVWAAGYEEKAGSEDFLNSHGFAIDNVPLGPIPKSETDLKLTFRKAWPVSFSDSTTVEVLCSGWGYPVIVAKKIGAGRLVVIGDSEFLLARNLEDAPPRKGGLLRPQIREENLRFIASLMKSGLKGVPKGEIQNGRPIVSAK